MSGTYTREEIPVDTTKVDTSYNVIKEYCKRNRLVNHPILPDDIMYHTIGFLYHKRNWDPLLGVIHFIDDQAEGYSAHIEYFEWEDDYEIVEGLYIENQRVGVWKHWSTHYRLRAVHDYSTDTHHYYYPVGIEFPDDADLIPFTLYDLTDEIIYHTCKQRFTDSIKPSLVRELRQQQ